MKRDFFAVGVGASGGGLEALGKFFDHVPFDPQIAYIVITHIKRDYKSRLGKLLSAHTNLPIISVRENTVINPGNIYLMVENTFVTVEDGELIVRERMPDEIVNKAINIFFRSLAADFGEKAIGIVLSGAGDDGLDGAIAISREGGYIMTQTPDSSLFSGMPISIIEHDHPSAILDPDDLARQLMAYVNNNK
jgi:two-component system CheB/CheR fusion protein